MIKKESRNSMRKVRHERVRKNVFGTSSIPRYAYSVLIKEFMHKLSMMKLELLLYLLPH